MRLVDYFRNKKIQRSITKYQQTDMESRMADMDPKILEEDGSSHKNIKTTELFKSSKPKSRKLFGYLSERRSGTRRKVGNLTMIRSPWDYKRLDSFYEQEAYFSRSVIRQTETLLRNGYEFSSDKVNMLAHIKKQLARVQMDSEIPFDQFIFTAINHLLKYGIVIVHKVRERVKDEIENDNKKKKRITRLRVVNPHHVMFYVDEMGHTVSMMDHSPNFIAQALQRRSMGKNKRIPGISASDLMVIRIADAGDDFFPRPPCFQMLDDILTLRSIEETIELLIFQFGSPLLHIQVGTDEFPAMDGETGSVNNIISEMAPNGMVTTDHRVKIDTVNLQKGIANMLPYLEHFKNRVLVGTGSSPISVGEGDTTNRNTAESIDDALADHCKYVGSAFTGGVNFNLIPDLLLIDDKFQEKDLFDNNGNMRLAMEFNEPRLEKMIAISNNVINLWQANLISFTEARKKLNLQPGITESDLYYSKIQIPLGQKGNQNSTDKTSNKAKSQSQPSNQHGTKAGPGSRKD